MSGSLLAEVQRLKQLQRVTGNSSRLLPGLENGKEGSNDPSPASIAPEPPSSLMAALATPATAEMEEDGGGDGAVDGDGSSSSSASSAAAPLRATSPIALRRFEQRYEGRKLTDAERAEEADATLKRWEAKRGAVGDGGESYASVDIDADEEELRRLRERVAHLEGRLRGTIEYDGAGRSQRSDEEAARMATIPLSEYDRLRASSDDVYGSEESLREIARDGLLGRNGASVHAHRASGQEGGAQAPSELERSLSLSRRAGGNSALQASRLNRQRPGRGNKDRQPRSVRPSKYRTNQAASVEWNDNTHFSSDGAFSTLGSRNMADELRRHVVRSRHNETSVPSADRTADGDSSTRRSREAHGAAVDAASVDGYEAAVQQTRATPANPALSDVPLDVNSLDYPAEFAARKVFGDSNGVMTAASVRAAYRRRRQLEEERENTMALRTHHHQSSLSSSTGTLASNGGTADTRGPSGAPRNAAGVATTALNPKSKLPPISSLERDNQDAQILPELSHEKWCCDPAFKLVTSNKVRDCLRANTAVILRAPLIRHSPLSAPSAEEDEEGEQNTRRGRHDQQDEKQKKQEALEERAEAMRKARLVFTSILNECILYSNETGLPQLEIWGLRRDPLRPEYAEVLIRPHRKYGSSDYQEVHKVLQSGGGLG